MANINQSSQFSADISNFIQKKTLPRVQRQLVVYQFGDMLRLPKNRGTQYTASRYDRVPLPFAPLSEGVPPVGEAMSLTQAVGIAQQWGDTITVTDVADLTIDHPIFDQAIDLVALQSAETLERNTFNNLLAGTQINYVNSRGSRAALVAGDVLNPHEINRGVAALRTIGAWEYMGQLEEDQKVAAGKPGMASKDPRGFQHYVSVIHSNVEQDMRENSSVTTAWSYSDINKLYNNELGEWNGVRFCRSNLVPSFTGAAAVVSTSHTTGGTLADGTYTTIVTASDGITGYETVIYQFNTSSAISGGTGHGSVTLTTPATTGFTYNVYIGTTTSPVNLGASTSGPTVGPLAGQAVQIAPGTAVTVTAVGSARVPPAAPATGITVYPSFIFGKNAYGQVQLDDMKFTYLTMPDKSDPLNQLRVVGWKVFYGTMILNQQFFMRIEGTSAFSATFG